MSYTVFALKWRPQDFDAIIGQPRIVTNLKSAVENGRLANAWLFAGPRGVGKTSTARILAKSLNCKKGPTIHPCRECASCKDIGQGRSLDVIEIDGASNRGIDEIRTLRENVKFAPVAAKYKIYIIDEVHMLTTEAFNALLKTLEEPPEFVKFIFATTHPHKVLPTVLSRCQRFDFRRIGMREMVAQLQTIADAEGVNADKDVLYAIARASDGSLRDAESVLDQLAAFSEGSVSLSDVISVLGMVEQETLFEITDLIIRRDPAGVLTHLNNLIDQGKDIGVLLNSLIEHIRNLMVAKVSRGDAALIDLPQESCERLVNQAQKWTLEGLLSAFNILVGAQETAKRLDTLRIPLEVSLLRLAQPASKADPPAARPVPSSPARVNSSPPPCLPQAVSPRADCSAIKDRRGFLTPPPDERDKNVPPIRGGGEMTIMPQPHAGGNADQPPAVSLDAVKDAWKSVVGRLEKVKISVAHYLNEGEAIRIQGAVLTIVFPQNLLLHKEALDMKDNKALVEQAFSEALSARLRVACVLSPEAPQKREETRAHPTVQSAIDMFEGRILKEE